LSEGLGAARDEVEHAAEQQKNAAADRLAGLGRAFHKATDDLAKEMPDAAAAPMHSAAEALEGLAGQLKEKNISELASSFESLARKQPVASFAACVLAGFALTHFLKSSSRPR
jgi:hypothetical protein